MRAHPTPHSRSPRLPPAMSCHVLPRRHHPCQHSGRPPKSCLAPARPALDYFSQPAPPRLQTIPCSVAGTATRSRSRPKFSSAPRSRQEFPLSAPPVPVPVSRRARWCRFRRARAAAVRQSSPTVARRAKRSRRSRWLSSTAR